MTLKTPKDTQIIHNNWLKSIKENTVKLLTVEAN